MATTLSGESSGFRNVLESFTSVNATNGSYALFCIANTLASYWIAPVNGSIYSVSGFFFSASAQPSVNYSFAIYKATGGLGNTFTAVGLSTTPSAITTGLQGVTAIAASSLTFAAGDALAIYGVTSTTPSPGVSAVATLAVIV